VCGGGWGNGGCDSGYGGARRGIECGASRSTGLGLIETVRNWIFFDNQLGSGRSNWIGSWDCALLFFAVLIAGQRVSRFDG
jgi:hypothetical protein